MNNGLEHERDMIGDKTENKIKENKDYTPSMATTLQTLVDRILHFVSHASNETLGACVVGLCASTYFVLGRIGLILIGVVAGIALHATWEGTRGASEDKLEAREKEGSRRKELGLDVVNRVWKWRGSGDDTNGGAGPEDKQEVKLYSGKTLDFTGFDPETAGALEIFTGAVIRDYVKYGEPISQLYAFVNCIPDGGMGLSYPEKNRFRPHVAKP